MTARGLCFLTSGSISSFVRILRIVVSAFSFFFDSAGSAAVEGVDLSSAETLSSACASATAFLSSAACFALTSEGSAVIVLYPPQPDMDKHSAAERASIIVLVLFMWSLLFSMSLIFECLSEILIFCCLKWTNRGFIEKTLDKT